MKNHLHGTDINLPAEQIPKHSHKPRNASRQPPFSNNLYSFDNFTSKT